MISGSICSMIPMASHYNDIFVWQSNCRMPTFLVGTLLCCPQKAIAEDFRNQFIVLNKKKKKTKSICCTCFCIREGSLVHL